MNYTVDREPSSPLNALAPWLLIIGAAYFGYQTWIVPQRKLQQQRDQFQLLDRGRRPVSADLAQIGPSAAPRPVSERSSLEPDERKTIGLFEEYSESVVYIKASVVGRNRYSREPMAIPRGTGSGFVWDQEGHIVTNNHVIEGANRAQIILADQSSYMAELVGTEPDKDLAVLKIDAPAAKLKPIPIGRSDDLRVGQNVYAIGNPFGFDQTLTTGVISGLEREIKSKNNRKIQGVVQTDAAINPGNSGGPLLDSAGRLIGVNTAIFSPSGAYAGIGFAIPVNTVNRIVPQLVKFGRVVDKPRLGVSTAPIQMQRRIGINTGVLVFDVIEGSAAAAAGVRPTIVNENEVSLGDIITKIDGEVIRSRENLLDILDQRELGETAEITVVRGAETDDPETLELQVTLRRIPST